MLSSCGLLWLAGPRKVTGKLSGLLLTSSRSDKLGGRRAGFSEKFAVRTRAPVTNSGAANHVNKLKLIVVSG
jgi:hypothetical protein